MGVDVSTGKRSLAVSRLQVQWVESSVVGNALIGELCSAGCQLAGAATPISHAIGGWTGSVALSYARSNFCSHERNSLGYFGGRGRVWSVRIWGLKVLIGRRRSTPYLLW